VFFLTGLKGILSGFHVSVDDILAISNSSYLCSVKYGKLVAKAHFPSFERIRFKEDLINRMSKFQCSIEEERVHYLLL
jgi:hypothetical protein